MATSPTPSTPGRADGPSPDRRPATADSAPTPPRFEDDRRRVVVLASALSHPSGTQFNGMSLASERTLPSGATPSVTRCFATWSAIARQLGAASASHSASSEASSPTTTHRTWSPTTARQSRSRSWSCSSLGREALVCVLGYESSSRPRSSASTTASLCSGIAGPVDEGECAVVRAAREVPEVSSPPLRVRLCTGGGTRRSGLGHGRTIAATRDSARALGPTRRGAPARARRREAKAGRSSTR